MNHALLNRTSPHPYAHVTFGVLVLLAGLHLPTLSAAAERPALFLPAGQEVVVSALFAAPGLTAPKSIQINKAEIVASWPDGRRLFVRHAGASGAQEMVRTKALVVLRGKAPWPAADVAALTKHIVSVPPPVWRAAGDVDPARRGRRTAPPSKDTLLFDDLMRQTQEALSLGERKKAKRLLAKAQKMSDVGPSRRAQLGELLRLAGDEDIGKKTLTKAIADLKVTVKERPGRRADWVIAMARLDPKAAHVAALAGLEKDEHACKWAQIAIVLRKKGATDAALAVAVAISKRDPKCEAAWITRALAGNEALSAWPTMLKIANEGLKHLPESLSLMHLKAGALHAGFRNREAAEIWEQVARRDLQFPGVMGMLATAWTQLPEVLDDDFLDPFHARLKREPKDVVSRYIVGTASYYRDDYEAVIRYLDPLRSVVFREPRVHLYTAMAHFHLGHRKEAEERLETLQKYGHNDPDYYYCRSVMRRETDFEASLRDLETFVRLSKGRQNSAAKVFKMHRELEVMRSGRLPNAFDMLPDWLRYSLMTLAVVLLGALGLLLVRWRRREG